MTTQEKIVQLQSDVQHNCIDDLDLDMACEEFGLNLHDDILAPIGYNTCDRCGNFGDSELDFLWIDSFDWEEDNPKDKAIIKALEQEGIDYCAICWKCVGELARKGRNESHIRNGRQ